MPLEIMEFDQLVWSQSLDLTQDFLIGSCSSEYLIMWRLLMLVSFQITRGHVISHDLLRIMFPEFNIDKIDFFQGQGLYFLMAKMK
jgi:hypothetical protein